MENLDLNISNDSSSDGKMNGKEKEKSEIAYENWVYKITESNKLIKYYLVIIEKIILLF